MSEPNIRIRFNKAMSEIEGEEIVDRVFVDDGGNVISISPRDAITLAKAILVKLEPEALIKI